MSSSAKYKFLPVFNPEGRLLQIEYSMLAIESSKYSSLVLCSGSAAILLSEREISDSLSIPRNNECIHKITSSIFVCLTGLQADCDYMVSHLRQVSRGYKFENGEEIPIEELNLSISSFFQNISMHSGVRNLATTIFLTEANKETETVRSFVIMPAGKILPVIGFTAGKNSDEGKIEVRKRAQQIKKAKDEIGLCEIGIDIMKSMSDRSLSSKDIEICVLNKSEGGKVFDKEGIEKLLQVVSEERD